MQIESRSKTFVKHPLHGASPDADVASSADTSREQSGLRIDSLAKPRSRPPLGLPNGSVRALLTILIVAVVISQVARGQVVSTLWTETLMIALAHYFSTRRFIKLAPELIHQLEAAGAVETELHPLFLPNRSIRIMIFAAFGGLAIYLYAKGRLLEPEALSILGVVFAYFFGTIARMALHWWTKGKQTHAVRGWQDIKALVVIAVLAYTAGDYLLNPGHPPSTGLRNTTLGMVLFYFGSR
jgi:hypothetical protein